MLTIHVHRFNGALNLDSLVFLRALFSFKVEMLIFHRPLNCVKDA